MDFGLAQRVADVESSKLSMSRQPLSDSAGRFNKNRKEPMLAFGTHAVHTVSQLVITNQLRCKAKFVYKCVCLKIPDLKTN